MFSSKRIKRSPLNEESILKKVSEYDIYSYYIGDFRLGIVFSSPLHKDRNPSFGIFAGTNGRLMFNDYVKGAGTCFNFVMKLFVVDYWTALNIINNDMKLGLESSTNVSRVEKKYDPTNYKPNKNEIRMAIKKRKWNLSDKLYWKESYQITCETLIKFNVYPISHYYINGVAIRTGPVAYAYHLAKGVYKIYQPNLKRNEGKFFTNVSLDTPWQGVRQIPKGGDILLITSSLKDVLSLYECGYNAIAPHTEHQILTNRLFNYYKSRWKHIVIFYDHDKAGLMHAERWKEEFGLPFITTENDRAKDPSDYVKLNSSGTLINLIELKLREHGIKD